MVSPELGVQSTVLCFCLFNMARCQAKILRYVIVIVLLLSLRNVDCQQLRLLLREALPRLLEYALWFLENGLDGPFNLIYFGLDNIASLPQHALDIVDAL